jgi:hypothetical protein
VNEAFPIHIDLTDSYADFNKEKPGGIFTKHLYDPVNEDAMKQSLEDEEKAAMSAM